MRIAQVGNYDSASQDGVTSVIVGLSDALVKQDLDVEVWQFRVGIAEVLSETRGRLTLYRLPLAGGRVANTFRLPAPSREFLKRRAAEVDVMHIHSVFTPHNIWASRSGPPYVLSPHNGYSPRVRFGRRRLLKAVWFRLTEYSLLHRSAALHAVTEREREDLALLKLEQPVFVIPNGVPQETIRAAPKTDAGRYLLFLGRLDTHVKGLDLLIDAYAAATHASELPELVIAGPDVNGSRKTLELRAAALGVSDLVRFTGPVTGLAKEELLDGASAFVLTSRWEGFPLVALEAMAVGLPLIATDGTNLGPMLSQRQIGWSSAGTIGAISANLQRFAETPKETILAMGARAQACVRENYTWEKVADQMTAMYRSIVAAHPRGAAAPARLSD